MSILIIETRSLPATNTEQGRIRASSPGHAETVTVPFSYSSDDPHRDAAAALLAIIAPEVDPEPLNRSAPATARGYRFTIYV